MTAAVTRPRDGGIQSGDEAGGEPSKRSGYRLPTETEMEFATRAGSVTSRYFRGDGRAIAEVCVVQQERAGPGLAGWEKEAE